MPTAIMSHLVCSLVIILALGLASCQSSTEKSHSQPAQHIATANDTSIVALALLPTMDCLPYYYAAERGYFSRHSLTVRVLSFDSQRDCDTAIIGRTQAFGVTDEKRLAAMAREGQQLEAVQSLPRQYSLVVCGHLRIKSLPQLALHTIGASRISAAQYWLEKVAAVAGIPPANVMRPQINSLHLRTTMLDEDQLDAAILPEPYASMARAAGHRVLWTSAAEPVMACLVVGKLHKRADVQANALLKSYDMAVDSLNARGKGAARDILLGTYGLTPAAVDSLTWPKFEHASRPTVRSGSKARHSSVH